MELFGVSGEITTQACRVVYPQVLRGIRGRAAGKLKGLGPGARTTEGRFEMWINVMLKDIDGAFPRSSQHCPIARAFCRTTGHLPESVEVDVGYVVVGSFRWRLPLDARRFITFYDSKDESDVAVPISFNLIEGETSDIY